MIYINVDVDIHSSYHIIRQRCKYNKIITFVCMYISVYPIFRVDSVSASQDVVKSGELVSAALYDVLPSSCPDQPAVPSDAYAAEDTHQEEGEASF